MGWKEPLEKEMATHSNIVAQRIPWIEKPADYNRWGCEESDVTDITLGFSYQKECSPYVLENWLSNSLFKKSGGVSFLWILFYNND